MTDPVIQALNQLCNQLFEASESTVRNQAERNLAEFQESPECLNRCMLLLEQGELPYGPIVASSTLMKIVSAKNNTISIEQKLELSRYLLNLLGQRAPQFEAFAVTSLCQVFARITKQEWAHVVKTGADEDCVETPFREPAFALLKTINVERIEESLLAIQLLNTLVNDMNNDAGVETLNKQRRNSAQFREEILYQMFKFSLDFLWDNVVQVETVSEVKLPLICKILELALNCMLFDFVGMSGMDDPGDENTNVQVPNSWKTLFSDGRPANMIYKLYSKLPQNMTEKALHFGVQIASVRRSFFTQPERQVYMEPLVLSVRQIIEDPNKLSDPTAFHQFARMIVRMKTNYQLYELMYSKDYPVFIRSLAEFTVQSLMMPELSSNSIYFLLMFWSRMVASVPYNRGTEDHLLNVYVPEIYKKYVESRLENVERVLTQGAEDPLEDQGAIIQTMEYVAVVSRCEYEKCYLLLTRLFDENAVVLQNTPEDNLSAKIAKGRLIWLVTFMGTAIYGKILVTSPDEMDKWDGDMLARCINVMRISDQRLTFPSSPQMTHPENGCERLEVSFIYLLECFRKVYIFSAGKCNSPVYEKLSSEAGIADETAMTGFFSQKVINNLRFWALNENVLELTLDMFKELSHGYSAVRKLIKLHEVQMLLHSHTPENFAFLGPDVSYETMKNRTVFYDSITRILFVDLNEDDDMFKQYMSNFTTTVNVVMGVINGAAHNLSVDQLQRMIIGLCRDIRGVALACTTKTTYQMLFDWMYPNVFKIMHKCVEEWTEHREVILSVFRLLEELCQNRQERLKFELNSCSAVLMFKETSKIITEYGSRYPHLSMVAKENTYKQRYKVIASIFRCIKFTLVGAYIPFGVFRLYGDWCLRDVLMTFVKLFRSIPEEDMMAYPKLTEAYYSLLENVVHTNMPFISNVESDHFTCILRSISGGVTSMNSSVSTSSCSALDDVLTYLYKRLTRPNRAPTSVGAEPEGDQCIEAIKSNPEVLADMLTTMLSALVFNEVKCQWSMSRPLLGLILLQEEVFSNYKQQLIQSVSVERQPMFSNMFDSLMTGVDRSLTVKNKDNFTHNLHKFRRDVMDVLKMSAPQGLPSDVGTTSSHSNIGSTNTFNSVSDPQLVDMS